MALTPSLWSPIFCGMFTVLRKVAGGPVIALLITGCTTMSTQLKYPSTNKTNVVDNYHGTMVADPYRWLEDDNASATKAWVEAQNKVTFAYLNSISERAAINQGTPHEIVELRTLRRAVQGRRALLLFAQ